MTTWPIMVGVMIMRPQSDDKGPSASLAPSAAGSTYSKYASPAAFGRRLAAGPFSASWGLCDRSENGPSASLAPSAAGSTYRQYASPAAFGGRLAAGPFSASWDLCDRSETSWVLADRAGVAMKAFCYHMQ